MTLPQDIKVVVAWLAEQARNFRSIVDGTPRLQGLEVEGFKNDLMLRTWRWLPDRVSLSEFNAECLSAGMRPEDIAKLIDPLRRRQAGRRLVPKHERRTWTYDRLIANAGLDPDEDLDIGEPSEDW
jgi:hypothetical protein